MTTVRTTAEFQAAIRAGVDPRKIHIASGDDDARAQARAHAIQAERARCLEIHRLAGASHPDMAVRAISDGTSVEALGYALFMREREKQQSQESVSAITERWKPSNDGGKKVAKLADHDKRQ